MSRVLLIPLLVLAACAYPRRSTPLLPAATEASFDAPDDLYRLEIVSGHAPSRPRSNPEWDEGDPLPDPFVRIYREDVLIYETPVADNTYEPTWNALTPNLVIPRRAEMRIELWDSDRVGEEPIGISTQRGLPPNLLVDADMTVRLDASDAVVVIRLRRPQAKRGVGIRQYEVRSDAFVVLDVIPRSPAGRAGIRRGDRILAIGGRTVEELGEQRAASTLALAVERGHHLTVEKESGSTADVELDSGLVWSE